MYNVYKQCADKRIETVLQTLEAALQPMPCSLLQMKVLDIEWFKEVV